VLEVRRVRRGPEFEVSGPLDQLSDLQNGLAWRTLTALSPGTPVTEQSFKTAHQPIRLDALESYVRGLLADAPDQKLKLFASAVRIEPSFGQAQFQLGLALFVRREYRSAAEAMSRVPAGSPRGRSALFYLGLARYHQGNFADAAKHWRALSELVPIGEVFNNLGAALSRAGEPGAANAFEKAAETDPSDPDYHFNLGYVQWRAGDFERAAASLRLSLERRTEDDLATIILGRCLQKIGPRPGDLRTEAVERLKTTYNESAFLALKMMLRGKE
jgi:tetratricopeptide (TPR) repeat protein